MKRNILLFVTGMVFITALSFRPTDQVKKDYAQVNQAEGVYIFMQCKPMTEYEVLGTVKKTGMTWSGKPKEMFNTILRKAKNDYPNCEGVIFDDVDMEHGTCIKFK